MERNSNLSSELAYHVIKIEKLRNSVEKWGKIHSEKAEKIAHKKPPEVFYIEPRAEQKKNQK